MCGGDYDRSKCPTSDKNKQTKQINQSKPNNNTKNTRSKQNKVPTPIDHAKLRSFLNGYNETEKEFLSSCFGQDFSISFLGNRTHTVCSNLPSVKNKTDILKLKIDKDISCGRVAGPFSSIPIPNLHISPLGLITKSTPGEYSVIQHLSYPKGSYVNDSISNELCSFKYQTIDNANEYIHKFGPGTLMSKTDIEHALFLGLEIDSVSMEIRLPGKGTQTIAFS